MMQRKTEPFWAQPTLEILLALPLVMGPPLPFLEIFWPLCPTWCICFAFFPMDARTPLLVRPHLEKIYPLLVDRFLPVHPGTIIKPLVRCGTPPLHLALLGNG